MDNILNTITAYREERKWSLYDLATHAELKTSTISTWYNNNAIPTIPSLVKICDAFQITLSEFFAKAEGSESVPVALTPQQIVSIKQASQRMGLPEYYIRRLCREVPGMAFQSGIKWYINLGKMADYFNGGTTTL